MTAHARTDRVEMTVDQFLDWPGDGTGRKFQLIDGVPRAMAPAKPDHSVIQLNIGAAITFHLRRRGMPCRVGTEGAVVPPLKPLKNARVPDIVVACSPPSASPVFDTPLLIVEVLSPSNEDETWESIRALAGLRSLQEILVVWSTRVEAEVYRRTPAGDWPTEPEIVTAGGTIHLASIGLDLPMPEVYRMTLLAEQAGLPPT